MTSSKSTSSRNTNSSKTRKSSKKTIIQRNLQGFAATFAGIAVGVPMAVAALTPVIKAEVAADTSGLSRTVNVAPAAGLETCSQPTVNSSAVSGAGGAGASAGNVTSAVNPLPTLPGNTTNVNKEFKEVGNLEDNTTATISNTGPESTNKIETTVNNTTTVTNDNNLTVSNNNEQNSNSGVSVVKENTTGGAAVTGDATNTNTDTTSLSVQN